MSHVCRPCSKPRPKFWADLPKPFGTIERSRKPHSRRPERQVHTLLKLPHRGRLTREHGYSVSRADGTVCQHPMADWLEDEARCRAADVVNPCLAISPQAPHARYSG